MKSPRKRGMFFSLLSSSYFLKLSQVLFFFFFEFLRLFFIAKEIIDIRNHLAVVALPVEWCSSMTMAMSILQVNLVDLILLILPVVLILEAVLVGFLLRLLVPIILQTQGNLRPILVCVILTTLTIKAHQEFHLLQFKGNIDSSSWTWSKNIIPKILFPILYL